MTSSTEGTMDGLHDLLAERARYEGWIAQLEGRRDSAPRHVLERVRADYSARLDSVTGQLRARATDLEATVSALQSRLAALAAEEETRRDERAETELRASVGEFAPQDAESTIGRCDEAIASLTAQRGALGAELAKLQDVLVLVHAPVVPATPVAVAPAPEPVVEVAPEPVAEPDSVLESIAALAPDEPPVPAAPDASPAAARELEFLRSIVSPEAAAAATETQGDMVVPPLLSAPRRQATPMGTSTIQGLRDPLRSVAGDGSLSPANMPAFLKDMPTEQVKTLKCQECSTMNYPTEWYCERCGGELAAM